jgi:aspartyl-tRNA(Asn)/glutamyl-tRNA(Gln) amidotransferase subunit C
VAIERKEVEHVAKLARLELSEDEVKLYTEQLGRILDHVDKLDELDTESVEPLSHAAAGGNVFRKDETKESLPRELVLRGAPRTDGVHFRVPPVVE